MACEILRVEGDLVSAKFSGVMRLNDQQALQDIARQIIERGEKVRLLAILEGFQGWEKGVDWGDIDFMVKYDDRVFKMAIIGDMKWREKIFAFVGKGLRATEIEFFTIDRFTEALSWVRA